MKDRQIHLINNNLWASVMTRTLILGTLKSVQLGLFGSSAIATKLAHGTMEASQQCSKSSLKFLFDEHSLTSSKFLLSWADPNSAYKRVDGINTANYTKLPDQAKLKSSTGL